jgi:hypothetical protein
MMPFNYCVPEVPYELGYRLVKRFFHATIVRLSPPAY